MEVKNLKEALEAAITNLYNCIRYRSDFSNKSVSNFKAHNATAADIIIQAQR
jgi:hypothetical protein